MRRHPAAAAIMTVILASAVAVTAAVVSAGVSLWTGFPSTADLDPARVALLGTAWIVMLMLWSVIATVIGGALHSAAQEANSTVLRFEAKAGLRRRYPAGELDAQRFDRIDRDEAA